MAFANVLVKNGYEVNVEWKDVKIKGKLEKRFGIDLGKVNFIREINRGDGYDICFWVSDGSIPLLRARRNFLHFQVPFTNVNGRSLLNRMKFFRIDKVICNSLFTKNIIDKEYGINSAVIYPPVDTKNIKPQKKEDMVLYVGRFSELLQSKRQDVLIDVFKKLYKKGFINWRLVMAGGAEVGTDDLLKKIIRSAQNYPIEIKISPSYEKLIDLYGKAKLYWSASGFSVDEKKEPKKVEHFGISVVEAMSARAVPLVYNSGGFKEIIKNEINGYLWSKKNELFKKTSELINNKKLLDELSTAAKKSSMRFSYENFEKEVFKLL